jgi:hypothetical protein
MPAGVPAWRSAQQSDATDGPAIPTPRASATGRAGGSERKRARAARVLSRSSDPKAHSRNGLKRSAGPAGSDGKRARAARVLRRGSDLQLSRIPLAFQLGTLHSSPTPPMAQQSRPHEPARPAKSSHVHVHADAAVRRGRALRATCCVACCMRDTGVLRRRPPVLRTAGASHRHRGRTWGSVSASGSVEVS